MVPGEAVVNPAEGDPALLALKPGVTPDARQLAHATPFLLRRALNLFKDMVARTKAIHGVHYPPTCR